METTVLNLAISRVKKNWWINCATLVGFVVAVSLFAVAVCCLDEVNMKVKLVVVATCAAIAVITLWKFRRTFKAISAEDVAKELDDKFNTGSRFLTLTSLKPKDEITTESFEFIREQLNTTLGEKCGDDIRRIKQIISEFFPIQLKKSSKVFLWILAGLLLANTAIFFKCSNNNSLLRNGVHIEQLKKILDNHAKNLPEEIKNSAANLATAIEESGLLSDEVGEILDDLDKMFDDLDNEINNTIETKQELEQLKETLENLKKDIEKEQEKQSDEKQEQQSNDDNKQEQQSEDNKENKGQGGNKGEGEKNESGENKGEGDKSDKSQGGDEKQSDSEKQDGKQDDLNSSNSEKQDGKQDSPEENSSENQDNPDDNKDGNSKENDGNNDSQSENNSGDKNDNSKDNGEANTNNDGNINRDGNDSKDTNNNDGDTSEKQSNNENDENQTDAEKQSQELPQPTGRPKKHEDKLPQPSDTAPRFSDDAGSGEDLSLENKKLTDMEVQQSGQQILGNIGKEENKRFANTKEAKSKMTLQNGNFEKADSNVAREKQPIPVEYQGLIE